MIPWRRAAALVVLAAAGAGTGAWACRDGGSAREAPVAATERPDAGGGGAAAGRGPAATAASPPVERLRVRVVASYPHDPDAFTQGLLWHDGALYESTGRYGRSSLRLVDLATGVPQVQVPLPRDLFAEGLALAHGRLVQLTWLNGRALVWSLDGLTPVGEHRYRGEGWGLTFDGRSLVMSDGSAVLTFRDPQSFAVERRLKVRLEGRPLRALNELEWARGALWANLWTRDEIARIDPHSGEVTAVVEAAGLLAPGERRGADVLNGIAYRPETDTFLLTGKLWPRLFEVVFE